MERSRIPIGILVADVQRGRPADRWRSTGGGRGRHSRFYLAKRDFFFALLFYKQRCQKSRHFIFKKKTRIHSLMYIKCTPNYVRSILVFCENDRSRLICLKHIFATRHYKNSANSYTCKCLIDFNHEFKKNKKFERMDQLLVDIRVNRFFVRT